MQATPYYVRQAFQLIQQMKSEARAQAAARAAKTSPGTRVVPRA